MDQATLMALTTAIKLVASLRTHPVQVVADKANDIWRRARPTAAQIQTAVDAVNNTGLTPTQRGAALDELGIYITNSGLMQSRG